MRISMKILRSASPRGCALHTLTAMAVTSFLCVQLNHKDVPSGRKLLAAEIQLGWAEVDIPREVRELPRLRIIDAKTNSVDGAYYAGRLKMPFWSSSKPLPDRVYLLYKDDWKTKYTSMTNDDANGNRPMCKKNSEICYQFREKVKQFDNQLEAAGDASLILQYHRYPKPSTKLFLSGVATVWNKRWLQKNNIKYIFSLVGRGFANQLKEQNRMYKSEGMDIKMVIIDILDKEQSQEQMRVLFSEWYEQIQKKLHQGHNILLHCVEGASRSGAMATAIVMKALYVRSETNNILEDALLYLRNRRPRVDPIKYLKSLEQWEDTLYMCECPNEDIVKYKRKILEEGVLEDIPAGCTPREGIRCRLKSIINKVVEQQMRGVGDDSLCLCISGGLHKFYKFDWCPNSDVCNSKNKVVKQFITESDGTIAKTCHRCCDGRQHGKKSVHTRKCTYHPKSRNSKKQVPGVWGACSCTRNTKGKLDHKTSCPHHKTNQKGKCKAENCPHYSRYVHDHPEWKLCPSE